MVATYVLSAVAAILSVIISMKLFKDAKKEEVADKVLDMVRIGVNDMIPKLADGKITPEEAGDFVEKLVEEGHKKF